MQWKCYELVIQGKTWARNPNKTYGYSIKRQQQESSWTI